MGRGDGVGGSGVGDSDSEVGRGCGDGGDMGGSVVGDEEGERRRWVGKEVGKVDDQSLGRGEAGRSDSYDIGGKVET